MAFRTVWKALAIHKIVKGQLRPIGGIKTGYVLQKKRKHTFSNVYSTIQSSNKSGRKCAGGGGRGYEEEENAEEDTHIVHTVFTPTYQHMARL